MESIARSYLIMNLTVLVTLSNVAFGSTETIYSDPFDLGAGGTQLTRASRNGRIFANPALLPLGDGWHRWFGSTTAIGINAGALKLYRTISGTTGAGTNESSGDSTEGSDTENDGDGLGSQFASLLQQGSDAPIRASLSSATSWITSRVAVAAFGRGEVDLELRNFGDTGLPGVRLTSQVYQGYAASLASPVPGLPFLTLGSTVKYFERALDFDFSVDLLDIQAFSSQLNPNALQFSKGYGVDLGSLLFFQGRHADLSVAYTIHDFKSNVPATILKFDKRDSDLNDANDSASGDGSETDQADGNAAPNYNQSGLMFKKVTSVGLGLAFHSSLDALHLAVDLRDIHQVNGEPLEKRLSVGLRFLVRTYLGIAVGLHDSYPSLGLELDLILCRLGLSTYTRELGQHVGVEPRQVILASISADI